MYVAEPGAPMDGTSYFRPANRGGPTSGGYRESDHGYQDCSGANRVRSASLQDSSVRSRQRSVRTVERFFWLATRCAASCSSSIRALDSSFAIWTEFPPNSWTFPETASGSPMLSIPKVRFGGVE